MFGQLSELGKYIHIRKMLKAIICENFGNDLVYDVVLVLLFVTGLPTAGVAESRLS